MPWVDVSDNDPGRVDLSIRAAIHLCWHALPEDQQNLDAVERHFRRLVDRAFRNLREDGCGKSVDRFPRKLNLVLIVRKLSIDHHFHEEFGIGSDHHSAERLPQVFMDVGKPASS